MFYILEILNRFKYIIFSYFCLFLVLYINYNTFFSILDYLFKKVFDEQNKNLINYYIYTHPFELYYTQIYFCFIISSYIFIPYLFWQFLDYYKNSFYYSEYQVIYKQLNKGILFFFIIYNLFYIFILPFFLEILQIAKQTYESQFYTIFFELKVQDFINFILYINTIVIISIFFILILSFSIFKITLLKILRNKKIFYLIALVFSTFISPPDILSQLVLLIILLISIEMIIFLRLIIHYLQINSYGKEFVDNIKK